MSTRLRAAKVRRVYEFIKTNRRAYDVTLMCRLLELAPSDSDAWLREPISRRVQEDARLLRLIRASFVASHGIYDAPRVFLDLREAGGNCPPQRGRSIGYHYGYQWHQSRR